MTPSLPDDVKHLSWAAGNWGSAPRLRTAWSLSARYRERFGSGLSGGYRSRASSPRCMERWRTANPVDCRKWVRRTASCFAAVVREIPTRCVGHGPPGDGPWYGLLRQCQCATEGCGRLSVSFGENVAVHPQGYRSVGMAQSPGDRPHVVATGDQLGGGEVTKRMEMRIDAGSFLATLARTSTRRPADWLGTHRRPREDKGVRRDLEVKVSCQFVDLGSVPPQDLECNLVDSDVAAT